MRSSGSTTSGTRSRISRGDLAVDESPAVSSGARRPGGEKRSPGRRERTISGSASGSAATSTAGPRPVLTSPIYRPIPSCRPVPPLQALGRDRPALRLERHLAWNRQREGKSARKEPAVEAAAWSPARRLGPQANPTIRDDSLLSGQAQPGAGPGLGGEVQQPLAPWSKPMNAPGSPRLSAIRATRAATAGWRATSAAASMSISDSAPPSVKTIRSRQIDCAQPADTRRLPGRSTPRGPVLRRCRARIPARADGSSSCRTRFRGIATSPVRVASSLNRRPPLRGIGAQFGARGHRAAAG